MIEANFDGTDQKLVMLLKSKGTTVIEAVRKAIDRSTLQLQLHIVTSKLQGQVLHHRKGILAASIRAIPAAAEGTSIVGRVEGAGGPAWYGVVHEHGGTGPYEIVPKSRK